LSAEDGQNISLQEDQTCIREKHQEPEEQGPVHHATRIASDYFPLSQAILGKSAQFQAELIEDKRRNIRYTQPITLQMSLYAEEHDYAGGKKCRVHNGWRVGRQKQVALANRDGHDLTRRSTLCIYCELVMND